MEQPHLSPSLSALRAQTRRWFLQRCGVGLGAAALQTLLAGEGLAQDPAQDKPDPLAPRATHHPPRAKRVLYLHMAGSPSQIDLLDPKPKLRELDGQECSTDLIQGERFAFIKGVPKFLGSPYDFAKHGESGTEVSELFPHLATCVDDLALIRSMHTTQFNHAPAQVFLNTGHERIGRPSLGSWLSYGLGSLNRDLPAFVVMLSGKFQPSGGAALWSSGFLPTVHQAVRFRSQGDPVLFLSNPDGMDAATRRRSLDAVGELNARRLDEVGDPEIATRIAQYEMAYRMQTSVPELLEIDQEPESVREAYGVEPGQVSFANNALLARRLLERGVRFVQLYHWGWDSHGTSPSDDIVTSLKERARETDRPIAALLKDLKQRGLLDDTLVVWGGEFGRTPMNEERNGSKFLGRDHHPHCFSMWLAGGGVPGGQVIGATDELGYHITERPVSVHDLHATMLHLLGFDHKRLTHLSQGRDFRLTDVHGEVVREMVG